MLQRWGGKVWTGYIWLRVGTSGGGGSCEHGKDA
jgi:hypothetical protein